MAVITRDLIIQGGLVPLGVVALPTNTSAVLIFATPPAGTQAASLSIFAGTLTVTFFGETPVASTTGHDLVSGAMYDFAMSGPNLKKIKGIGGATGYITYWAVP